MSVNRLIICAAGSLLAHAVLARVLDELPERTPPKVAQRVDIRVVAPPPAPTPIEPPPELPSPEPPPAPPPPTPVQPPPRPRPPAPRSPTQPTTPAAPAPPTSTPSATPGAESGAIVPGAAGPPVFGATMESTSQGGTGPAVPIGNSSRPGTGGGAGTGSAGPAARGTGDPVPAAEVTRMPLPRGRCAGAYTDAARAAATEGTVVLDLIVDARGRARDIVVVEGLPNGLSEAAIEALRTCPFSPGERGGEPVPVRVRGFKIRFVLQEAR
ncbi:MAG: TonB family protein [Myxococcales bacterium]|nr:TonB family protein [Myxococcales bacterium]